MSNRWVLFRFNGHVYINFQYMYIVSVPHDSYIKPIISCNFNLWLVFEIFGERKLLGVNLRVLRDLKEIWLFMWQFNTKTTLS